MLACLALLWAWYGSPAAAATLEEGKAAYLAKDYARAMAILKPLADKGDPEAQLTLGIMYDYGQGVPKDDAQAVAWYRKAALQGFPTIQHNLGVKYFEGIGIGRDYGEAARWWRMAADAGFAESQYSLGELYAWGLGTAKDEREAAKWYRLAADQSHVLAQYRLGVLYASGRGVPVDNRKAYGWLRRAAEQGMPQAQYQVGRFLDDGVGTARNEAEALRWYRLSAAQGFEKAKRRLATMNAELSSPPPAPSAAVPAPVAAREQQVDRTPTGNGALGELHREDWIKAQDPQHYTVQLVTASNEKSVIDAVRRGGLPEADVACFKRSLTGGTAYTMVYGVFPSRETAAAALSALPPKLRKSHPWVRSFADVQALLVP